MQEFLCLFGTEAVDGAVATVTDRFGDTVRAAVHLRHNRGEQCRAFRAKGIAGSFVMAMAVDAEGFADVGFFFRDVVLYFYRFPCRQETRKNAHIESPFSMLEIGQSFDTSFILKVFGDKSKSPLTSRFFIVKFKGE